MGPTQRVGTHLHSRRLSSLDDGHGLAGVYPVLADRVAVEVSDWLNWKVGKRRETVNQAYSLV